VNNFIFGFFYPFKCIKLFVKYPKLILYSIVPIVINLIIYGTIFFYTYRYITGEYADIIETKELSGFVIQFLNYFMKLIAILLVLLICYFAFIIFGGIVSAPFNEKISRLIEELEFGEKVESNLSFTKEAFVSIKEELKKILFYFTFIIPLFLINFIPMIGNTISLVFGSAFSFFYNAFDYMDYPLSRRFIKFRQKLKIIDSKRTLSMGFGAMAFILTFLPVINVMVNPLLVVAGTRLFYEKDYDKLIIISSV
jgi:CysZ protein